MPSLRDLIQGKDQDEQKIKNQSKSFQDQYGDEDSDQAPVEEGIEESDLSSKPMIGPGGRPMKEGALPPPGGWSSAEGTVGGGRGVVQRLIDAGYDENKLNGAAEDMRLAGSHTMTDATGKATGTIGEQSPLGQELKRMGRDRMRAQNASAPSLSKPYGK